ncbi:MAG: hypothetical protein WDW38_000313 [Sanguina aurantia]
MGLGDGPLTDDRVQETVKLQAVASVACATWRRAQPRAQREEGQGPGRRWLNCAGPSTVKHYWDLASVAGAMIGARDSQWVQPQFLIWMQKELAVKDPLLATTAKAPPVVHLGTYGATIVCVVLLLVPSPVTATVTSVSRLPSIGAMSSASSSRCTMRSDRPTTTTTTTTNSNTTNSTAAANASGPGCQTDAIGRVAYANIASRHLFNEGSSLHGLEFSKLLDRAPGALRQAVEDGEDALISVEMDGSEETFRDLQLAFRDLQGCCRGRLQLFRRMTRELSRQEVATWKRVIRVISHELNNSLAPISSLAHSGAELARRGDVARLPGVFATISERARHLHSFISGYASFAKLPTPQSVAVEWAAAFWMACQDLADRGLSDLCPSITTRGRSAAAAAAAAGDAQSGLGAAAGGLESGVSEDVCIQMYEAQLWLWDSEGEHMPVQQPTVAPGSLLDRCKAAYERAGQAAGS